MSQTSPKSVLIVEDDAGTQHLLVALMKRNGLEPVVTANGQDALELLRQRTFGVIILDLMMPVVSGYEVISFLKSEGRSERVIVCTAAGPRSTETIDSSHVVAVVRKPFDIEELTSLVTSTLGERV